jgi:hypothetical protein
MPQGIVRYAIRLSPNEPSTKQTMSNDIKTSNSKNQAVRLYVFLQKNKEVSTREITKSLRIANPTAVVHKLRENGVKIYTNPRRSASGKRVFKYRLA